MIWKNKKTFSEIYNEIVGESPQLGYYVDSNILLKLKNYIDKEFNNDSDIILYDLNKAQLAIYHEKYDINIFLMDKIDQKLAKFNNFHYFCRFVQFPVLYKNIVGYRIDMSVKFSDKISKSASTTYLAFLHFNKNAVILSDYKHSNDGYYSWLEIITNTEIEQFCDFVVYNIKEHKFYPIENKKIEDIWGNYESFQNILVGISLKGNINNKNG